MALSTKLTAKAGPPLTTSSANSSTYQSSTPNACPKAVEMGVKRLLTASDMAAIALRILSTTAVACHKAGLDLDWCPSTHRIGISCICDAVQLLQVEDLTLK